MRTVYLDYNATTPLDPRVREAMLPFFGEVWGNPSSVHRVGRRARAALDDSRDRVAAVFGCKPAEVIFTSGGTESNNLAIFGAARLLRDKGRHLVTSAVEHHAVLHCFERLARREGFEVTFLPVDSTGRVAVESLAAAIRPDTVLVSVMAANNEVGTIQPVAELGALCRSKGILFHTDAVQWFGKEAFSSIHQFNADLVSLCAHKFYGPKGVGALFIRSPLHPEPILFGGGHENERRAGTENVAGIVGLTSAVEWFLKEPVFPAADLARLSRQLLESVCPLAGVSFCGSRCARLSNTVSFMVDGIDGIALIAGLDLAGVCASSGAACSAGSLEPSHVLQALGVRERLAGSLLRFSLGRETTPADIATAAAALKDILKRGQHSQ